MERLPRALARAVLAAVPLALVVLIVVTPGLIGRDEPATNIPFLLVQVMDEPWNETVGETAMLYVRSALGVPLYDFLGINATGSDAYAGRTWTANQTNVPSLWLKLPVDYNVRGDPVVNVTAVAIERTTAFRFNATIEFVVGPDGTVLRVLPDGAPSPREYGSVFTASMRREVMP